MSERLSEPAADPAPEPAHAARRGGTVGFAAAVVAAYAVVGAACGWAWERLWDPPSGVVYQHQWFADGDGLRAEFSGTGLYVLIAAVAGLVLGMAAALLGGRRPLVALAGATTGAVLAGWLMWRVGTALGPPDPAAAARTAEDGTRLVDGLRVNGLPPLFAFPAGTLAAMAFIFSVFPGRSGDSESPEEPRR